MIVTSVADTFLKRRCIICRGEYRKMAEFKEKFMEMLFAFILILAGLGLAPTIQSQANSLATDPNTSSIGAIFYGMIGWIWAIVLVAIGLALLFGMFKKK